MNTHTTYKCVSCFKEIPLSSTEPLHVCNDLDQWPKAPPAKSEADRIADISYIIGSLEAVISINPSSLYSDLLQKNIDLLKKVIGRE